MRDTMTLRSLSVSLALLGAGAMTLSGCQSKSAPGHVPPSYFEGTSLDRNPISAKAVTEYLEVRLNPEDSQLRLTELAKLRAFLADYNVRGHGPLIMSAPKDAENPQLSVQAVVEARELAWEAGIEYTQITGSAYDAAGRPDAPLVLAFRAYEAVAPDCKSLSQVDFSNSSSNNDMVTLGCAVRANMAAMIADPADIYGLRALASADAPRRDEQFKKWRGGEPTGSQITDAESGTVSNAVQ